MLLRSASSVSAKRQVAAPAVLVVILTLMADCFIMMGGADAPRPQMFFDAYNETSRVVLTRERAQSISEELLKVPLEKCMDHVALKAASSMAAVESKNSITGAPERTVLLTTSDLHSMEQLLEPWLYGLQHTRSGYDMRKHAVIVCSGLPAWYAGPSLAEVVIIS